MRFSKEKNGGSGCMIDLSNGVRVSVIWHRRAYTGPTSVEMAAFHPNGENWLTIGVDGDVLAHRRGGEVMPYVEVTDMPAVLQALENFKP